MHRVRLTASLLVLLLSAGCLSGAEDAPTSPTTTTPSTPTGTEPAAPEGGPSDNATRAPPGEPERFLFYLTTDYALSLDPPEEGKALERIEAGGFARYFASGAVIAPWSAPADPETAWEIVGEMTATLSFVADSPGASSTEPIVASVGGWWGAQDRWDWFMQGTDAPKNIEGGKVYTITMKHEGPPGGWLVRPGEAFIGYPYVGYHANGVSYVIGGASASTLSLTARPVDLGATAPVEALSKSGEIPANADVGAVPAQSVDVPFTLPEGTVYAVVELTGAPAPPSTRMDADLEILTPTDEHAGGSHGPTPKETAVLGPGNLAKLGREYVARISASMSGPGTYALKVTAYVA